MTDTALTTEPIAKTAMLIRRPAGVVFEAFTDPAVTTQFWFTKSSGRLVPGTIVRWEWEMYGFSIPVAVEAVEPERRIALTWPGVGGDTRVEWSFDQLDEEATFVTVTNSGFAGPADSRVAQALDSTEGFSLVLAACKALLEHGVRLNVIADRFPKGLGTS